MPCQPLLRIALPSPDPCLHFCLRIAFVASLSGAYLPFLLRMPPSPRSSPLAFLIVVYSAFVAFRVLPFVFDLHSFVALRKAAVCVCQIIFSATRVCFAIMAGGALALPPAKRTRLGKKTSPFYLDIVRDLGPESDNAHSLVYLIAISRVLPRSSTLLAYRDLETLKKEELVNMIRDALDDPVPLTFAGGRPCTLTDSKAEIVMVVKEAHADGCSHFHAVVKLNAQMRFKRAKRTLEERYLLPSHWSCTHTQLWSAIRYVHIASPKKPTVDPNPCVWTRDEQIIDLVESSRKPFVALAWRKHREAAEAKARVEETSAPSFNKLDFIALVLTKHLHTKASLLAYVQDRGSPAAQLFASKSQRRLVECPVQCIRHYETSALMCLIHWCVWVSHECLCALQVHRGRAGVGCRKSRCWCREDDRLGGVAQGCRDSMQTCTACLSVRPGRS